MKKWKDQAKKNIDKFGHQPKEILILAMVEELGELSQALLEYKHAVPFVRLSKLEKKVQFNKIYDELDDLSALMYQMKWALDTEEREVYSK